MEAEIFKAYDIRGLCPGQLDDGIAYLIGRALVTHTGAKEICVGNDMRETGVSLKAALIQGIIDQGASVVDVGLCSTPLFYFATKDYAAGIMVTASHNPAQYNGFKMCSKHAIPIGQGTGMEQIHDLVLEANFSEPERKGTVSQKDFLQEFITFGLSFLTPSEKKFKIVVDTANGMGGYTYTELQKHLPKNITLIPMYFELDGTFPNHEANPLKDETLVDLQKRIVQENADLGVAIDGDADRVFFVDEKGTILHCGHVGALLAKDVLKQHPGSTMVYDVRNTKIFPEVVAALGGKTVEAKVGHAFLKHKMREVNGSFGVERSGHFFNPEVEYTENEIILFMRLLNVLSEEDKPLSELMQPFQKYPYTPETNFSLGTRAELEAAMSKVEEHFADEAMSISHLDGIKLLFDTWWFSLRASNTEPLLRLVVEADTQEILDEKFTELKALISPAKTDT